MSQEFSIWLLGPCRVALRQALVASLFWPCAAWAQSPPAATDERPNDLALCSHAKAAIDQISACTRLILGSETEKAKLPDILRVRGAAYLKAGDYESAVRDFSDAIDRRFDFADAYENRGMAKYYMQNFDGALADLNRAITLNNKSAIYFVMRGNILNEMGEYDGAIADFGRGIAIDDKYTIAYTSRAFSYHHERQFQKALNDFSRAIGLSPKEPKFYVGRASVKMDLGKMDDAVADLDKAIEIAPSSEALRTRGEAKRLKKDLDGAIADASRALEIAPADELSYIDRALVLVDKHDYPAALADLDQAIAINPKSALAFANRGKVERLQGDFDRSLRDSDKAVELSPKNPLALTWRGDASFAKGEYEKAIQFYNNANHFVSDFVAAIVGRGLSLEALGNLEGAKAEFERALKLPVEVDRGIAEPAQDAAREHLAKVNQALQLAADKKAQEAADKKAQEEKQKFAVAAKSIALPEEPPLPDPGVRVAMVIGMSNYEFVPALANPDRDAEGVAKTLRDIGFNSVTLVEDASRAKLAKALRDFQDVADSADWAMVYYAGHGLEMKGQNYLIPVDAKLETDRDVEEEAIPLDKVLERIHSAHKLQLVVLDACRDNPFANTMRRHDGTRGVEHQRGLARVEPTAPNELVVYAAKDGQVALDGEVAVAGEKAEHSPFAAALIKRLKEPRVEINEMFRKVSRDVYAATKTQQRPFVYGNSLDQFYFNTK